MRGLPRFPGAPRAAATGARVCLRLPRRADGDAWVALRRDSRAFLEPWEPRWREDHLHRSSFRRRVRLAREAAAAGRSWAFLIFRREDDRLLGGLAIENRRDWPAAAASLGYWIGQPHARRGYMRDAVETACRHAFTELGISRLEAACVPENVASQNLLLGCGFRHEGRASALLEIDGVWRDHDLLARLAPDRADPASGDAA